MLDEIRLGVGGQSQAGGTTPPGTYLHSRFSNWDDVTWGKCTYIPLLGDYCGNFLRKALRVHNFAAGASALTPLYETDVGGIIYNWSPSYSGDNLWKQRILGTVAGYAKPIVDNPLTHLEVMFGTGDASNDPDNFEANLKAFTDGLLALFPALKIMVHLCPGITDSDKNTVATGWDSYLSNNVDGVSIFAGADLYRGMANRGSVVNTSSLFEADSPVHFSVEGYAWASREIFRAYVESGWIGNDNPSWNGIMP